MKAKNGPSMRTALLGAGLFLAGMAVGARTQQPTAADLRQTELRGAIIDVLSAEVALLKTEFFETRGALAQAEAAAIEAQVRNALCRTDLETMGAMLGEAQTSRMEAEAQLQGAQAGSETYRKAITDLLGEEISEVLPPPPQQGLGTYQEDYHGDVIDPDSYNPPLQDFNTLPNLPLAIPPDVEDMLYLNLPPQPSDFPLGEIL